MPKFANIKLFFDHPSFRSKEDLALLRSYVRIHRSFCGRDDPTIPETLYLPATAGRTNRVGLRAARHLNPPPMYTGKPLIHIQHLPHNELNSSIAICELSTYRYADSCGC